MHPPNREMPSAGRFPLSPARPLCPQEQPDLRQSSIVLFGKLTKFSEGNCEVFFEQILNGLVTLLLHLQDPKPEVVKVSAPLAALAGRNRGGGVLRPGVGVLRGAELWSAPAAASPLCAAGLQVCSAHVWSQHGLRGALRHVPQPPAGGQEPALRGVHEQRLQTPGERLPEPVAPVPALPAGLVRGVRVRKVLQVLALCPDGAIPPPQPRRVPGLTSASPGAPGFQEMVPVPQAAGLLSCVTSSSLAAVSLLDAELPRNAEPPDLNQPVLLQEQLGGHPSSCAHVHR